MDCHTDSTNLLAMTDFFRIRFCDLQNLINNRSNGGVAFVFVRIFGINARLKPAESQKFLQVRNRIPQNKLPQNLI